MLGVTDDSKNMKRGSLFWRCREGAKIHERLGHNTEISLWYSDVTD